jgi:hypothetical protein
MIALTSDLPVPVAPTIVIRGFWGAGDILNLLNGLRSRNIRSMLTMYSLLSAGQKDDD